LEAKLELPTDILADDNGVKKKYQIKLISNETDYVDLVKDGIEYL
jgi:hypothetical protein